MNTTKYIPVIILVICMVTVCSLHEWTTGNKKLNPDTSIQAYATQQYTQQNLTPTTLQWHSTSSALYTASHSAANPAAVAATQTNYTTSTQPFTHLTSEATTTSIGGGYHTPTQQATAHFTQNNQQTYTSAPVLAMANTNSTKRTVKKEPVTAVHIAPMAQVATMASTTYDAPLQGRQNAGDDPFGGGGLPDKPLEPGVPVGEVPVLMLILLAIWYTRKQVAKSTL